MTAIHILLLLLSCTWFVRQCDGACAEVDSDTEAVAGRGFKLGCISCKMRSEVKATATVEWYFKARGEVEFGQIFTYSGMGPVVKNEIFMHRLDWNGSKQSNDIQDASIYILNVTFNDSGTYRCFFNRVLTYSNYENTTVISKVVHLNVVAKGTTQSVVQRCVQKYQVSDETKMRMEKESRGPPVSAGVGTTRLQNRMQLFSDI